MVCALGCGKFKSLSKFEARGTFNVNHDEHSAFGFSTSAITAKPRLSTSARCMGGFLRPFNCAIGRSKADQNDSSED
jgi:hypothetical protein